MRFLADTNVLIYTRERSAAARPKQKAATDWLTELARRELLLTNLQVLNEVCHAALRKLQHMSSDDVRSWVGELATFGDAPIDPDDVARAWQIREAYSFSWFDCLILSSADRLGCTHVLTEDMGSPRRVGPLHLVNPFVASVRDVLGTS